MFVVVLIFLQYKTSNFMRLNVDIKCRRLLKHNLSLGRLWLFSYSRLIISSLSLISFFLQNLDLASSSKRISDFCLLLYCYYFLVKSIWFHLFLWLHVFSPSLWLQVFHISSLIYSLAQSLLLLLFIQHCILTSAIYFCRYLL